jgi:hypothetical protein
MAAQTHTPQRLEDARRHRDAFGLEVRCAQRADVGAVITGHVQSREGRTAWA